METFSWTPDYQLKRKRKPEKHTISFGDGYSQQVGVGANLLRQPYDVTFTGDFIKIWTIEQFLEARGGIEDFLWTAPSGSSQQFYCKEWDVDYSTYNNIQLTTTFEQR